MPFPSMRSLEASHYAAPVALMLTIGLIHRSLMTKGFVLRRVLSTDTTIMILLVLIVNIWALVIGELIRVPWIALLFSWYWVITFGSSYLRARIGDSSLWRMNCVNGPFGWRASIAPYWLSLFYAILLLAQLPCSITLILHGDVVEGILSLASLGMFLASSLPKNQYVSAAHGHAGDALRIALPTSHIEGTVYILPSRSHGFEATWSPKIRAEHLQTDAEIMELFAVMRSGSYSLSEPLKRLRSALSPFNAGAEMTDHQVNDLAEWLLMAPGSSIAGKPMKANRPPNVHLIGRDLMFALSHAEYLVFMRKEALRPALRQQLGRLRQTKRSGGLDGSDETPTVGYKEGLEGYQEAVRYVYTLFDSSVDPSALNPPSMPAHQSVALGRRVTSTEDFVASLWTICLEHSESTFSALYMFSTVWFIEVGNVGGFHIFPLRCESQQGDPVAWQAIWRQGWYECMTAQLIASSPLMAMAFITGIF